MQLHLSTWQEIESYLRRSTALILPVGSTEQHGPTGLIGTDALCAEVIAEQAGREGDILVGPTFPVGSAQHHLGFPGTMSLRPSTMMAALGDWIMSLAHHGFTHVYVLNGHGGNTAVIQATFAELYARQAGAPCCVNRNWWEFREVTELCKTLYPAGHGSHATPSEIAVTWFARPSAVKHAPLDPKIAPTGTFTDADDYRRRFPDGRIGSDPSLAKAEDGARLVAVAARAVVEDFRRFIAA